MAKVRKVNCIDCPISQSLPLNLNGATRLSNAVWARGSSQRRRQLLSRLALLNLEFRYWSDGVAPVRLTGCFSTWTIPGPEVGFSTPQLFERPVAAIGQLRPLICLAELPGSGHCCGKTVGGNYSWKFSEA